VALKGYKPGAAFNGVIDRKGIKAKGKICTQYAHAIDMVPTVLEALGLEPRPPSRASRSRRSRG
jgi:arylsulfatase A-like enzyme